MYISEKILKLIFILLIGIATVLSILTLYFYLPTLINRFGLNKTPSKEVLELLTNYNMTQTPEIYKAMDEKVMKIAQTTPSIDISNCTPFPRIVKTDISKPVIFSNNDSKTHTLIIGGRLLEIQSNKKVAVLLSYLEPSLIVSPYSCDNLNSFDGILTFTKSL